MFSIFVLTLLLIAKCHQVWAQLAEINPFVFATTRSADEPGLIERHMKAPPSNQLLGQKNFSQEQRTRAATRLHYKLFRDFYIRRLVKPVAITNETLEVKIGLALIQLIDIDELNQVMTTNVWLYQKWKDSHLSFDPAQFDGIKKMDIPAGMIWLPDLVLYNSADGLYAIPPCLRVRLRHDGTLMWDPPIIYKSFCEIDIQWFPFDQQNCSMKFGSWTYDGLNINLIHINQKKFEGNVQIIGEEEGGAIDFANFRENTEWTVTDSSAKRTVFKYSCCPTPYVDVTFYIVTTRKPLFIVINLLFPCFIISFLSIFVFYLPAQSGEKMSLSVSILVALIMFFLVVFEKIPATSLTLPLFAKFLIFTLILVTLSIVLNVAIIRVHWMAIEYRTMPFWIRRLFLETLAPRLMDPDPKGRFWHAIQEARTVRKKAFLVTNINSNRMTRSQSMSSDQGSRVAGLNRDGSPTFRTMTRRLPESSYSMNRLVHKQMPKSLTRFENDLINEFTQHSNNICDFIRKKNCHITSQEEWRVVAQVIDKIFFYIFVSVFSIGSTWIFWQAAVSFFLLSK